MYQRSRQKVPTRSPEGTKGGNQKVPKRCIPKETKGSENVPMGQPECTKGGTRGTKVVARK